MLACGTCPCRVLSAPLPPPALHCRARDPILDVRVCITVDTPRATVAAETLLWLQAQRAVRMERLRVRFNATNLGAGRGGAGQRFQRASLSS